MTPRSFFQLVSLQPASILRLLAALRYVAVALLATAT